MVAAGFWLVSSFGALATVWRGLDMPTHIAILAVAAGWLTYRLAQASVRDGVIRALRTELALHRFWTGNEWPEKQVAKDGSWENPRYSVFKLSTVAIDNAITQGPSLFLSRELVGLVVRYRQMLQHLNQLIEKASALQVGLADGQATGFLIDRIRRQTEAIHWEGIGDRNRRAAHFYYYQTCEELKIETNVPVSFSIWFLTGVRVYPFEWLIYWLFWRVSHRPDGRE